MRIPAFTENFVKAAGCYFNGVKCRYRMYIFCTEGANSFSMSRMRKPEGCTAISCTTALRLCLNMSRSSAQGAKQKTTRFAGGFDYYLF